MMQSLEKAQVAIDDLGRKARAYWHAVIHRKGYTGSDLASAEQQAYADLLDIGMRTGLAALVLTFIAYATGLVTPHIALEDLPRYWTLPVHDYLHQANVPTGWGWIDLAGKGDFLNFVPIAMLSIVTILCFARILPILIAKRDWPFVGIAVVEILVLTLAASGVLTAGH